MPQRLLICLLVGVWCTMAIADPAVSQEAGPVLSATESGTSATSPDTEKGADQLRRDEAPTSPTLLDDTAAKMVFLVVLALVGVGYVLIRNQPSSRDFKKKNKRK